MTLHLASLMIVQTTATTSNPTLLIDFDTYLTGEVAGSELVKASGMLHEARQGRVVQEPRLDWPGLLGMASMLLMRHDTTGQRRAGQGRAEHTRAGQGRGYLGRARRRRAERERAGYSR